LNRTLFIVVAMLLIFLHHAPASAQARPDRPYRGLFGGGAGSSDENLTLSGSAGIGYDSNVISGIGESRGDEVRHGTVNGGSVGLAYQLQHSKLSFGASGSTSGSYYPSLQDPLYLTYGGGVGLGYRLSDKSRINVVESLSYSPFYGLTSFPALVSPQLGQTVPVDEIQSAALENHILSTFSITYSHQIARRTELSLAFNDYRSLSASGDRDTSSQSASARTTTTIAKGLAVRLGYAFSGTLYGGLTETRVRMHSIDAGLDFARALSLSRRSTLTFGTGSTVFTDQSRTSYTLTGHAQYVREIGRSWAATVSFSRNAGIEDTYRAPVVSDSLAAGFGGLINRRLQVQTGVGAAYGNVGLSGPTSKYHGYYGTAGLTIGLTRVLGLSVNYGYYTYSYDGVVFLPTGLTSSADRQSIRANLNLQLPLYSRSAHAAR
jgi:hypothetical protein